MSPTVAVVTDSTACLPDGAADEHGIHVVPLQVMIGTRSGEEGIDIGPDDVAAALGDRGVAMQTSRPSPLRFQRVYDDAIAQGATAIVVVTLSSALSSTFDAAEIAGKHCGVEVLTVDSRSTAMGLGFAAIAAARVAAAGAPAVEVAEQARTVSARTRALFYVNTLEYLRRGGRIGAVRALLGTALSVKPILHIENGAIGLLEKVRTAARARARLIERTVEAAADREVEVALHYISSDGPPDDLAEQLREQLPRLRSIVASPLAATIAVHVGPGAIGVVVAPA